MCVWIVRAFLLVCGRVGLLVRVNRVVNEGLQGFEVSRQWTTLKAAGDKEPAAPVGVQSERLVAIERLQTTLACITFMIRRHVELEVTDILAYPLAFVAL